MAIEKLKEVVKQILPEVDVVIGYRQGFDPLHATPAFVTKPEQIDELIWNPLCVHNLTTYLPALAGKKKVGVVVKGCDSRTIIQFMQERLIDREKVKVIGVPCRGVISVKKVSDAVKHQIIEAVSFNGENITVKTRSGEQSFAVLDVAPEKCASCQVMTPLQVDCLAGEPIESDRPEEKWFEDVRELEKQSLEERKAFWEEEFDKCIRCYACRNACPLCVCQDHCIVESRDPHWVTQQADRTSKFMFHMIHGLHLAGRCTGCSECERVCPMDIPVAKIKKKINMELKELFGYVPGMNPDDKPPLYIFQVEEATIKEHKL
ncbi:MAG TPA: 4Fe-4S dicluster domain-containing protein [Thermodesulfobacteriota bacterium]|nr:4Fe-4S dicluster domain-containing protein [Deltaproteobacteria bacterium]HNR12439.1 4Fe-4S dicluster domain-containing protein [Thermodesulfobacteriota bacterium]HQO77275.1 4Fe-4S dicluster domain-containing protein [Thermodesulfobacteriota bacterium]